MLEAVTWLLYLDAKPSSVRFFEVLLEGNQLLALVSQHVLHCIHPEFCRGTDTMGKKRTRDTEGKEALPQDPKAVGADGDSGDDEVSGWL
jgi:hypothetical protein